MPAQATIDAEIADLKVRLSYEPTPDIRQLAQDRINNLQIQKGAAPVFGIKEAITKGKGGK